MTRLLSSCVPASLLLLASSIPAQSVVVPQSFTNTRGQGAANTILRDLGQPRCYMSGISASDLAGIPVGAVINGISFRGGFSNTVATWPPSDATWANYDIEVGPAIPLANWTTTFATNFASPPLQVRSGPMVIETGTYTNNTALPAPQPNAWGEFYFDFQRPFPYLGSDLAFLFRHTGSNLTTAYFLDWQTSVTSIIALTASSYQAATGTRILSPAITRLHYGYGAGCPGTGGMVPNLVQNTDLTGGTGGTIHLSIGNAPAGAPALFVLGFGRLPAQLPNGCALLTAPVATLFVLLNNNGRGRISIVVPPAVSGGFNAQAVVLDAGGPQGYTATNAVEPRAN